MRLVSNLLAEVHGLLCAHERIPLSRSLKDRLEPFSLKALIVHWSIWRAEGREVLAKGGMSWRWGEMGRSEGILVKFRE
jgi:hypothetical protein